MARVVRLCFAALWLLAPAQAPAHAGQGGQPGQPPATTAPRPGEVPGGRQATPGRDTSALPQVTGTATIKGLVLDADTGQPLRRAVVALSGRAQREPRSATTDDTGRFEIRELPAGEYFLSVQKSGYARTSLGQRRWNEPARTITLREGETVDVQTLPLQRGGVITGRVVDEVGEPVMDVAVRVMRKTWVRGRQRLVPAGGGQPTNDLGIYRAYGLQPGEYYVSAASRGFGRMFGRDDTAVEYAATYYPGTTDVTGARTVTVNAGQESIADISLIPTPVTRIAGVVLSGTGKPASGGSVSGLRRSDSDLLTGMGPDGQRGAPIRQDGTFTLTGLTPGTWTLTAVGGAESGPGGEREFAQQLVAVGGEDLTGVVLVLGRGGSVRGRVTCEGVPPQDVSAVRVLGRPIDESPGRGVMGMGARPANIAADGAFELTGLSGTVGLTVMGAPGGWSIKSVRLGGRDVYDTGFEVPLGRTVTGAEIVMTQEETKLTGSATDDRGTPLKDFMVVAFAEDREKWFLPSGRYLRSARANQDGVFTISGLAPGTYLVIALETLDSTSLGDPDELERWRGLATDVTLADREQRSVTLKVRQP
jgi:protocatechuate 3,4-dioxygenase beta subunit